MLSNVSRALLIVGGVIRLFYDILAGRLEDTPEADVRVSIPGGTDLQIHGPLVKEVSAAVHQPVAAHGHTLEARSRYRDTDI